MSRKQYRVIVMVGIIIAMVSVLTFSVACSSGDDGVDIAGNDPLPAETTTEAEAKPYSFTDDLGYEITVDQPKRVVACMGSFADIWLLAGGELVGVTQDAYDGYLDSSEELATVGDFTAPNLEEIISLDPDFVIMTGAATGKDGAASQTELKESLEASGITVAYFSVTTFDDYLRMLEICCDITGREDLYAENGSAVQDEIENIKATSTSEEPPTVLLMTTYSGGTRVQNSSTMTGAMLADLGATNLADETPSLLREFSLESVIEMNPDYILVVPMGNDDVAAMRNLEEATSANPAWASLDAVVKGNFVTLDKELFLYKPNENWGQSYRVLFDILYA